MTSVLRLNTPLRAKLNRPFQSFHSTIGGSARHLYGVQRTYYGLGGGGVLYVLEGKKYGNILEMATLIS